MSADVDPQTLVPGLQLFVGRSRTKCSPFDPGESFLYAPERLFKRCPIHIGVASANTGELQSLGGHTSERLGLS